MYQKQCGNEPVSEGDEQTKENDLEVKWNKEYLLKGLSEEARTPQFSKAYQQLCARHPALAHYTTPALFIGTLHAKSGDYAEKDRVLHAVISAIQNEPALQQCGLILMSLAMWPALEHSYYKLIHLSPCVPDLFAAIHGYFLDEILDFNPAKLSKIAINLQLNVKKRVWQAVTKEAQYQDRARAYVALDADLDQVLDDPRRNRLFQLRELLDQIPEDAVKHCMRGANKVKPHVLSEPDQTVLDEALHNFVEQGVLSNEEYRLIADHILRGMELQKIARHMGIRSNAVRARFFRIRAKLRPYVESE